MPTALLLALCVCLVSVAWAGDDYGGMRIDSAKAEEGAIRVSSTGAEFLFNLATGGIDLVQRIPERRLMGTITETLYMGQACPSPGPVAQTGDVIRHHT